MRVLITATYLEALDEAVSQLLQVGAVSTARRLESAFLERWPQALGVHPRAGRDYLERNQPTPELETTCARIADLYGAGAELREIIDGDYLAL